MSQGKQNIGPSSSDYLMDYFSFSLFLLFHIFILHSNAYPHFLSNNISISRCLLPLLHWLSFILHFLVISFPDLIINFLLFSSWEWFVLDSFFSVCAFCGCSEALLLHTVYCKGFLRVCFDCGKVSGIAHWKECKEFFAAETESWSDLLCCCSWWLYQSVNSVIMNPRAR